jgi:hypothetical protein
MTRETTRHRWLRWPLRALLLILVLLLGPIGVLAFGRLDLETHWSTASMASSGQAPAAREEPEPLIQVYGARAYNWRGAFGIHTWIATKRRGAGHYVVYQVLGWNLYRGRSAVSIRSMSAPDFAWFNAPPELLVERKGPDAEAVIDRIEAAVAAYPYARQYRVWPGPNSNTFTAFVARQIPELGLDLPPTAIGKDYLQDGRVLDRTPSGSGWQLSLRGLLGVGLGWEEGIEVNLLGLSAGLDLNDLALRLPGIGKVSLAGSG